jgi:hypothetical protein
MVKSKLEGIGNMQLFFILKYIKNEYHNNTFKPSDILNDEFIEICETSCKIVGVNNIDTLDLNFILATLLINNKYDFSTRLPVIPIKKPIIGTYSFEITDWVIEKYRRIYRHTTESYLDVLVRPTVKLEEESGDFISYEGDEIDNEVYDGDTIDSVFDEDSIVKIK